MVADVLARPIAAWLAALVPMLTAPYQTACRQAMAFIYVLNTAFDAETFARIILSSTTISPSETPGAPD